MSSTSLSGQTVWAGVIGFLLGALIVWLIGRVRKGGTGGRLQQAYDELKQTHADYQRRVNDHFTKTADAVDTLTQSYQEVFTHLSAGAEQLMDTETLELERKKRRGKAITLAYLSDAQGRESSKAVPRESVVSEGQTAPATTPPAASGKRRDTTEKAPEKAAVRQPEKPVKEARKSAVEAAETAENQVADGKAKATDEAIAAVKRHLHDDPPEKEDPPRTP